LPNFTRFFYVAEQN